MKNGIITELFNSFKLQAGNDDRKAGVLTANKIESLLNSGQVVPEDFKFNQLAFELIPDLDKLRSEGVEHLTNAISSSQFPVISRVVINKKIMDSYNLYSEDAGLLVTEIEGTRTDREFLAGFTDPEGPELRLEKMAYRDTNFEEQDCEVIMADFGRLISVTREAIYNDRTGQLLNQAQKIGMYGGQHRAKMIVQTLECLPRTAFKELSGASKAFTYKGTAVQYDAFFNATTHATIDGRVNPNLVTSNALADYTDVKAALDLFTDMKTHAGHELIVIPKMVIVHEKLATTAWQIFNSDQFTKVGQGADAAVVTYHGANPYGPKGTKKFQVYASRYLNSETTWYIGDPATQNVWVWVYKPDTAALAAGNETAFKQNIVFMYKFSYHGGAGNIDYSHLVKNTA